MSENREYKSDVFSMLMENKEYALQVYNALNDSSYDDPEQVEVCNLESGISLSIRNDAAFIVDTEINIYEHQSSVNPNMPLRALIYFTAIIQGIISRKDLLSSRLIRIPTPHFAVLYNGKEDRPVKEIFKLSSAYSKPAENPELELVCTVYNINPDKDKELLQKCAVLDGYTSFVELVRKNENDGLDNPIERAIDYCIQNHILEDFFRDRRAEVLRSMAIDMTFERRVELIREEEKEYGRAEGRKEGRAEGRKEGRAEGRKEGRAEGRAEGREEGVRAGTEQTHVEDIRNLMKNMNWTAEQAMTALGIAESERASYLEKIGNS